MIGRIHNPAEAHVRALAEDAVFDDVRAHNAARDIVAHSQAQGISIFSLIECTKRAAMRSIAMDALANNDFRRIDAGDRAPRGYYSHSHTDVDPRIHVVNKLHSFQAHADDDGTVPIHAIPIRSYAEMQWHGDSAGSEYVARRNFLQSVCNALIEDNPETRREQAVIQQLGQSGTIFQPNSRNRAGQ